MDREEYQEKMEPTHRTYLCRMLKVKDLPEHLLEVYQTAKILADRIDARLLPGNLAVIAMIGGEGPVDEAVDEAVDDPAEQPLDESLDESVDKAIEQTVEPPVEPPVKQAAEQAVGQGSGQAVEQPAEPPVEQDQVTGVTELTAKKPTEYGKEVLWSAGMPVNVLQEDDLKRGTIVNVIRPEPGSEKPLRLTVEFGPGETVTVNEDEVEAD